MAARILVIEDNDMNRDMLARRLQRRGYETCVAADGKEGIRTAHALAPDLILLDLSLPEIDGWEVARRLKTDPESAQIPIIALTAHALSGDRDDAIAAGCNDYETKPIEFQRLLNKIESLLPSPVRIPTPGTPSA